MKFLNNYSYGNNNFIRILVTISFYLSIFTVLTFVPFTGYLSISVFNVTTLPILVVFATYHLGFVGSCTSSLGFGIGSFLRALSIGEPSQLLLFPDISILSRLLMGLSVYFVFKIMGEKKHWKFFILAPLSVFFNTFWVSVTIFSHNAIIEIPAFKNRTIIVWLTLIYSNFILEIIIALILMNPLFILYKVFEKNGLILIKDTENSKICN
ncbi:hypothetical protein [[Mycoplasma] mobile]|uniref:Hypotethical membrane protein n=1 Tax=Mycoplasma mobile (strain ATCC 43663 / 163K / NCTC 11711) TaxID=267748 RepID=Q6KH55_MYCM1|nr:hypothetical protein [[Mycoplasma] mobile]AAT28076.1 hypotethical membrane protein [Mycoplasma mobile 163K]